MDTQSHLQYGFGIKKGVKKGIHKGLIQGKLDDVIIKTDYKNLDLIPADINFDISSIPNKKNRLKRILKSVEMNYDICIIDTPPTSDVLLNNALIASNYVLVPMQTEHLGLIGVVQFLKMFYKIASELNTKFKLVGVVPTLYNKSILEHTEIIDKLKNTIGENRVLEPIRKDFELSRAFMAGKPILYYKKRSRGSKDYTNLANNVLNII